MSYFKVKAVNNSSLKYIDPNSGGNPRYYKKYIDGLIESPDSKALEMGTLIHTELLEGNTIEIVCEKIPAPKVLSVIEAIWERLYGDISLEEPIEPRAFHTFSDEFLLSFVDKTFYANWGDPAKLKKIREESTEYWNILYTMRGKTILDPADYYTVTGCVENLKLQEYAVHLLDPYKTQEETTAENEVELFWTEEWVIPITEKVNTTSEAMIEIPMKAKLDRIIFNHKNKTITLVDLKTTRKALAKFHYILRNMDYDRQLAYYKLALKRAYPEYDVTEIFIVAVQTNKEFPVQCFRIEDTIIDEGWAKCKSLINRIATHTHTGDWGDCLETQQQGYININTFSYE